jgi:hypothetical protein
LRCLVREPAERDGSFVQRANPFRVKADLNCQGLCRLCLLNGPERTLALEEFFAERVDHNVVDD